MVSGDFDGVWVPEAVKPAVAEAEVVDDAPQIEDLAEMVREGIPRLLSAALRQAERGGEVKEIVPVLGMALKLAEARETARGAEWRGSVEWIDAD